MLYSRFVYIPIFIDKKEDERMSDYKCTNEIDFGHRDFSPCGEVYNNKGDMVYCSACKEIKKLEKENAELSISCEYALNREQELLLVLNRITKLAREEGAVELRTIKHIVKSVVSFDLDRGGE
jgi:hypothetical protein